MNKERPLVIGSAHIPRPRPRYARLYAVSRLDTHRPLYSGSRGIRAWMRRNGDVFVFWSCVAIFLFCGIGSRYGWIV